MARQDLRELGFQGTITDLKKDFGTAKMTETAQQGSDEGTKSQQQGNDASKRKREGFIAGLKR